MIFAQIRFFYLTKEYHFCCCRYCFTWKENLYKRSSNSININIKTLISFCRPKFYILIDFQCVFLIHMACIRTARAYRNWFYFIIAQRRRNHSTIWYYNIFGWFYCWNEYFFQLIWMWAYFGYFKRVCIMHSKSWIFFSLPPPFFCNTLAAIYHLYILMYSCTLYNDLSHFACSQKIVVI